MTVGLRLTLTGALIMSSVAAFAQTTSEAAKDHHHDPARHAAMEACRPNIDALCQGIKKKGGRIMACLAASPEPLPSSCRQALAAYSKSKPEPH